MKSNKLMLVVVLVLAAAAAAILLFKRSNSTSAAAEINVGWIGPLTGDAAAYGVAIKRGTDLAVQGINASGKLEKSLRVIYEDDQAKPTSGVAAFEKLTNVNHVPIVIQAAASSVMLAVMPKAEAAKVVYISPSCSSDKIRTEKIHNNYKYIFRTWPSDAYQAEVLARFAANELKAKKAAVLYINTEYGIGFKDEFAKQFEAAGGSVFLSEGFAEGTTDFRSLLTKTKDTSPDIVFIPSHYKEAAQLLKQAKELGVNVQFLADAALYSPELLKAAGNAADGLILTNPDWSPQSEKPQIKAFVEAFRKAYNQDPDVYAAAGYDLVFVLTEAIRAGKGATADSVQQSLHQMKAYGGVTGELVFDSFGEVRWGFSIFTVHNGSFTLFTSRH
jgi:branched-chain amino acid transport system substrate-binding protein